MGMPIKQEKYTGLENETKHATKQGDHSLLGSVFNRPSGRVQQHAWFNKKGC
jgi:hypothetical protein